MECTLPNICVVDIKTEETIRILGVYASESRSWNWQQISPHLSENCVMFGDFNVDLDQHGCKAESLLNWADSHFLAPFTPNNPTSRRANRIIDYAFSNSLNIDIQTYSGNTTSDHCSILSVLSTRTKEKVKGKSVHWKVFNLFTEYTFEFWENCWSVDRLNASYNDYIQFLGLLIARCTIFFPLNKCRVAIPAELRTFMSYVRALSFRQMRTKSVELKNEVRYLRKAAKSALRDFVSFQLYTTLQLRHSSSPISVSFWSRTKRFIKPVSSSLNAFISPTGVAVTDSNQMSEIAADYYEELFRRSESIVRPHPYVDAPWIDFENKNESIPEVTLDELIRTVNDRKKRSH